MTDCHVWIAAIATTPNPADWHHRQPPAIPPEPNHGEPYTMTAKKLIKDAAFLAAPFALTALQDTAAILADNFAVDLADIIKTNLPTVTETDEDGTETVYATIGQDEAGLWTIEADAADIGALVLVTVYDPVKSTQPDPTQAPLAVPTTVYLLNLPNAVDMFNNVKLTEARDELVTRHMLAAGRKIARMDQTSEAPLVVDRSAALLTVTGRGGANKLEAAFNIMFKAIQHVILSQAKTLASRLREAGKAAKARDIENTFAASRLNKATLKAAFQSKEAAEYHFPSLPQAQWEALLKMAIQAAPNFAPLVPVKDEASGKPLKNAEGKTVTQKTPKPQSPAIFQQWLATRDAASFDQPSDDLPALQFDGLDIAATV